MARCVTYVLVILLTCSSLTTAAAQGSKAALFKKTYGSDLEAFFDEVTKTYPFLDVKGIRKDWKAKKKELLKEVRRCKTDADFMKLVYDGIRSLRDAHMYVTDCAVELPDSEPEYYSGVSFLPATDDRVVIMHPPEGQGASLKAGMVVLTIDGKDARKVLEARAEEAWEAGGSFSSPQRARLFEYRLGLRGERGDKHVLVCQDGRKKKKVSVSCRTEIKGWAHTYNLPDGLERVGRSFYFTRLPSGVGYMYLRRVDSSIAEGIAKALQKHPEATGWIVDLRGNAGGGYNDTLISQVKAVPRPVAVLLDAGCISAGETLARDFVNLTEARLFGSTSAGSSSSKRDWPFPSGIATIKFSTRSRSGLNGQQIEFNGIEPDQLVEALPEEVQEGKNSAIQRAQEFLVGED